MTRLGGTTAVDATSSASTPVPRLQDRVARVPGGWREYDAHHLVVFGQQDDVLGGLGGGSHGGRHGPGGRADDRQIDRERRAFAGSALRPDEPAALLHHPVHGGQPQPDALADVLPGRKGLEDVGSGSA